MTPDADPVALTAVLLLAAGLIALVIGLGMKFLRYWWWRGS